MTDYGAKDRKAAEEAIVRLLHSTILAELREIASWILKLPGTGRAVIRARETEWRVTGPRNYPDVDEDACNVTIDADAVYDAFVGELSGATAGAYYPRCKTSSVSVYKMVEALARWVVAVPEREPRFVAALKELISKYPLTSVLGDTLEPRFSKWLARNGKDEAWLARIVVSSVASGIREGKGRLNSAAVAAWLAVLFNKAHGLSDPKIFRPDLMGPPGPFSDGPNGSAQPASR